MRRSSSYPELQLILDSPRHSDDETGWWHVLDDDGAHSDEAALADVRAVSDGDVRAEVGSVPDPSSSVDAAVGADGHEAADPAVVRHLGQDVNVCESAYFRVACDYAVLADDGALADLDVLAYDGGRVDEGWKNVSPVGVVVLVDFMPFLRVSQGEGVGRPASVYLVGDDRQPVYFLVLSPRGTPPGGDLPSADLRELGVDFPGEAATSDDHYAFHFTSPQTNADT